MFNSEKYLFIDIVGKNTDYWKQFIKTHLIKCQ
jgi:hypothetical protein